MPTIDTHRKTDPGASQEAETPQADDGQTRTVSPVVSMDFALLDKKLSNRTVFNNGERSVRNEW